MKMYEKYCLGIFYRKIGDFGDQVFSGSSKASNDQILIRPITRACAKKLKDQLNKFVHVVRELIEGFKVVEDLNKKKHSILVWFQVASKLVLRFIHLV